MDELEEALRAQQTARRSEEDGTAATRRDLVDARAALARAKERALEADRALADKDGEAARLNEELRTRRFALQRAEAGCARGLHRSKRQAVQVRPVGCGQRHRRNAHGCQR